MFGRFYIYGCGAVQLSTQEVLDAELASQSKHRSAGENDNGNETKYLGNCSYGVGGKQNHNSEYD
jgi:hypothetical protein